jgi:hypothetical protein
MANQKKIVWEIEARSSGDGAKRAQSDLKKLRGEVERTGDSAERAGQQMEGVTKKSTRGMKNSGAAILEASRAIEDLQYGIRGVLNNIPQLVQQLGGGAGLAGVISFAAVGASQLFSWLSKSKDEAGKLNEEAMETARAERNAAAEAERLAASLRDQATQARISRTEMDGQASAAALQVEQRQALATLEADIAKARIDAQTDDPVERVRLKSAVDQAQTEKARAEEDARIAVELEKQEAALKASEKALAVLTEKLNEANQRLEGSFRLNRLEQEREDVATELNKARGDRERIASTQPELLPQLTAAIETLVTKQDGILAEIKLVREQFPEGIGAARTKALREGTIPELEKQIGSTDAKVQVQRVEVEQARSLTEQRMTGLQERRALEDERNQELLNLQMEAARKQRERQKEAEERLNKKKQDDANPFGDGPVGSIEEVLVSDIASQGRALAGEMTARNAEPLAQQVLAIIAQITDETGAAQVQKLADVLSKIGASPSGRRFDAAIARLEAKVESLASGLDESREALGNNREL